MTMPERGHGSAEEPLDADVQSSGARPPDPLHPRDLLLVAVGGAAGSLARYAVAVALPGSSSVDWPLLVVNLLGAFCLGLLIELLTRRNESTGDESGRHRRIRLGVGTGFLGGFTTYSALAVGTVAATAPPVVAVGHLVLIVFGGLAAALLGVVAGARIGRDRA